MRRLTPLLFALSLLAGAGCSGRDSVRDAGDSTRSLVRVDLSYTHLSGAPAAETRFDAQAHFVRYRSFDPAGVPVILGFTDYDAIPLESCKVSDGTAALDEALGADATPSGLPAEVALLDAGRIDVRGPAERVWLRPSHYPELVPFVSGVVYGGDDTHPLSLVLGQSYQVSGEGGEEVGPFAATAVSPRAFATLAVEPLHRGSDLEVRWTGATEDGGEPLRLEAKWSSRAGSRAVRCRVRDDGEFAMPHEAFDLLPVASALSSISVTLTRLSRTPLWAPGAGRGELSVELRDVAPLQVTP
jgi:hypothetical protein